MNKKESYSNIFLFIFTFKKNFFNTNYYSECNQECPCNQWIHLIHSHKFHQCKIQHNNKCHQCQDNPECQCLLQFQVRHQCQCLCNHSQVHQDNQCQLICIHHQVLIHMLQCHLHQCSQQ